MNLSPDVKFSRVDALQYLLAVLSDGDPHAGNELFDRTDQSEQGATGCAWQYKMVLKLEDAGVLVREGSIGLSRRYRKAPGANFDELASREACFKFLFGEDVPDQAPDEDSASEGTGALTRVLGKLLSAIERFHDRLGRVEDSLRELKVSKPVGDLARVEKKLEEALIFLGELEGPKHAALLEQLGSVSATWSTVTPKVSVTESIVAETARNVEALLQERSIRVDLSPEVESALDVQFTAVREVLSKNLQSVSESLKDESKEERKIIGLLQDIVKKTIAEKKLVEALCGASKDLVDTNDKLGLLLLNIIDPRGMAIQPTKTQVKLMGNLVNFVNETKEKKT